MTMTETARGAGLGSGSRACSVMAAQTSMATTATQRSPSWLRFSVPGAATGLGTTG
jgi:hypothetical protein